MPLPQYLRLADVPPVWPGWGEIRPVDDPRCKAVDESLDLPCERPRIEGMLICSVCLQRSKEPFKAWHDRSKKNATA